MIKITIDDSEKVIFLKTTTLLLTAFWLGGQYKNVHYGIDINASRNSWILKKKKCLFQS